MNKIILFIQNYKNYFFMFIHVDAPVKVVLGVLVNNEYNILVDLHINFGYQLEYLLDYLAVLTLNTLRIIPL